jgi:hypothetical protein
MLRFVLQQRLGDRPALAALADDPVRGRDRVAEEYLIEIVAAIDLLQRPDLDAGLVQVEQQIGNAVMLRRIRFGPHQREHIAAIARIGCPQLLPVDHPLPVAQLAARPQTGEIRSRARLAEPLRPAIFAG